MPLYEYECTDHGAFELLRTVSEHAAAAHCPTCGVESQRLFSAPYLTVMPRNQVIARERNEQSRYAPRVSDQKPGNHRCTTSCSHGSSKTGSGQGLRAYGGKRPWVIEHG
jgi:putative FmdB family regulatory protein